LTVGDFDQDGNLDIASGGQTANTFSVYLGNGNGTFGAEQTYSSENAEFITAVDLDNDGYLDIVQSKNNELVVNMNNGDGTFGGKSIYAASNSDRQFDVGDINGDGIVDIIQAGYNENDLSIFIGNGDGTFQNRTTIETSQNAAGIAIGDLNGDGVVDFAVSETNGPGADFISAFLQDTQTTITQELTPISVATQSNAQNLLSLLDNTMDSLNEERSKLGALQNRLESAGRNSLILSENLAAAKSQILDTDVAQELTKTQILQQASVSVLGQANVNLQIVLELLRGVS
jgi:flagellin-like hook-associated protein FlgL